MKLDDLVERAAEYDERLARDIKDYIHGRKYGLVYEASKPEYVRMWKKKVVRGDRVNLLPPRGEKESKDGASDIVYIVQKIEGNVATILNRQDEKVIEAAVADLVAVAQFDKPIYAGLRETGRVERGGDKPYHVVINGENYHALQTLVYSYQGKVDCIYIDPPYNTGARDWKYNNNYVGKDDIYRHSKWLTFMEDRLKLAKKLLNPEDSVLIVTIDEKEYLRLGLLLEQMFPEAHIQMVTSMINKKAATRKQEFSRAGEYIYFVMMGKSQPSEAKINMMTGELNEEKKPISYEGLRQRGGKRNESPGCFYPLFISEDTGTLHSVGEPIDVDIDRNTVKSPRGTWAAWPINEDGTESRWQINKERFMTQLGDSTLVLSSVNRERESATVLYLKKQDLKKIEEGIVKIVGKKENGQLIAEMVEETADNSPKSIWVMNSHDASVYGTTLHKKFIPNSDFSYPKSLYAVEDCLRFFIEKKPSALVVDFFSGSGTTAHAVMRLNHQDDGARRCISVTNNEVNAKDVDGYIERGLRIGDEEWEKHGICRSITIPRITAAITGKTSDGNDIKGNYGLKRKEFYLDEDAQLLSKKTGKPLKRNVYLRKEIVDPSVPDAFPIADGFKENAVFFDLEYLEPSVVSADMAFEKIAPILWLTGGCKGNILSRQKGFSIGETYGILFETRYTKEFIEEVSKRDEITVAFIVTDVAERYRSLCSELNDIKVIQLYESYLRSFEINAIG